MSTDRIESILSDFAAQIRAEVQRQAVAALTTSLGPDDVVRVSRKARTEKAAPPSDWKATEPNGEKRDPKVIAALQGKVLAYIAAHPGLRIEQINAGLGTTTKAIFLPIRKLLAAGAIRAKGEKRATTYSKR